jgi:hypothetical protein
MRKLILILLIFISFSTCRTLVHFTEEDAKKMAEWYNVKLKLDIQKDLIIKMGAEGIVVEDNYAVFEKEGLYYLLLFVVKKNGRAVLMAIPRETYMMIIGQEEEEMPRKVEENIEVPERQVL